MNKSNLMSTGEVAMTLKVSVTSAAKYIRTGGIKGYCHPITGRCFAEREDVERIAKEYGLGSIGKEEDNNVDQENSGQAQKG